MAVAAQRPVFQGEIKVDNAMKMSYAVNGVTNYGESYRLEYESPERKAALEAAKESGDPGAEIPPALIISASFDTTEGGPSMLEQGALYKLTLEKVQA